MKLSSLPCLAVIAVARGWKDIERYGKAKEARLRGFLSLEHGIPHHDVYRRVMGRIIPEEIERCFMNRVRAMKKDYEREIIAIDGKTVRGHFKGPDFSVPAGKNREIEFHSVSTHDEKHGRIEDRDYAVGGDVRWPVARHPDRKTIGSIGVAASSREEKGEVTVEQRHFVSGLPAGGPQFAKAVRSHWGIENSLHYVLDVVFGEDGSRLRKDMAILRKVALTVARADTETKSSIIGWRKRMAWSNEYLERLLFQSPFASGSG
jgi:predicted transposase YbfD/YdcC